MNEPLRLVFLGLSISSWANAHATTYRALLRALAARGHAVTFLERDQPLHADNRDLPAPSYARTLLYRSVEELFDLHAQTIAEADFVVVGSYVPDGIEVGRWVQALARGCAGFYDIDTPVTLAALAEGGASYLSPDLIPGYSLYLSSTGGPALPFLERTYGSPAARALPCSADPELYFPEPGVEPRYDLGYLGTYGADEQAALDALLVAPAQRLPEASFIVGGASPSSIAWPPNVARFSHVPPQEQRRFHAEQRLTLHVTRAPLVRAGWSPSARLFEAAACATPLVSDDWPGLGEHFTIGKEVLVARSTEEMVRILRAAPTSGYRHIGEQARTRFLAEHTPLHRAEALERFVREALDRFCRRSQVTARVSRVA